MARGSEGAGRAGLTRPETMAELEAMGCTAHVVWECELRLAGLIGALLG